MANEVKFKYGSSADYTGAENISSDEIYFTTEEIDGETVGTIYKGSEIMGTSVADKLVLPMDLDIIGTSVGNLTNGSTIAAGTSITDLLVKMLQQETKPGNPTSPSATLAATATMTSGGGASIGTATQVEVGTIAAYNVVPTYKDGSFTSYTSATATESINAGITLTSGFTVSRTSPVSATLESNVSSGSAVSDEYQITAEGQQIKYSATGAYVGTTQTVKSNIMEEYEYTIADGSVSASVSKCTGYYRYYYGILEGISDPTAITQSDLSSLTNALLTATVNVGSGATSADINNLFVVAIPSSKSFTCFDALATSTDWVAEGAFTETELTYSINEVETDYTLYTINGSAAESYGSLTITK